MVPPGTPLEELDTPCLVVDLERLEANIHGWQEAIRSAGCRLRPHVKTHKAPEIAAMQLEAGASGITVARVAEAEVFAAGGCEDIFIAYPLIGRRKWRRAAELARRCRLIIGIDSEVGARGLSEAASLLGVTILARVEIDTGLRRCGVRATQAEELCRLTRSLPGLELDGLFTFRGIFFAGASERSAEVLGREEGEVMAALAQRLREVGIPIREVSVGSTPTARYAARVDGVTEVRPGTYVFGDYMQAAAGVIPLDEIALSIICTVVSLPATGKATIDGGSKTFSGDIPPERLGIQGYARAISPEAFLESMSEEHGVIGLSHGTSVRIGDKIAFFPLHVCTAVNLSDRLVGVRRGVVERVMRVAARGKRS